MGKTIKMQNLNDGNILKSRARKWFHKFIGVNVWIEEMLEC